MLDFIQLYWIEFVTIAGVHFLAVASPGPDFAIVLKHSITFGRRAAIFTSIGIGLGILVHVIYSLLGIGLLIKTTPWLFNAMTYLAAAYLTYIGVSALRSMPNPSNSLESSPHVQSKISDKKAFWVGLLTNGLNPKATLFFLSVFAVVVAADTPNTVKMFYGVYLTVATGAWFCGLSLFLSTVSVRQFIGKHGHWFDRIMGSVLILLAVKLVFFP